MFSAVVLGATGFAAEKSGIITFRNKMYSDVSGGEEV
jgi:hypothetical protein